MVTAKRDIAAKLGIDEKRCVTYLTRTTRPNCLVYSYRGDSSSCWCANDDYGGVQTWAGSAARSNGATEVNCHLRSHDRSLWL
jgi:hypothetical protein